MKKILFFFILVSQFSFAQVKISSQGNGSPVNQNAWLELANNSSGVYGAGGNYKGLLLPKVDFTNNVFTNNTVWGINGNTPVEGLMIYNTGNRTTSGFNGIGVYYWDASQQWVLTKFQPLAVPNEWSLSGNAGTTASNFIGSTDARDVIFKTNNTERVRITSAGNIGIGNVGGTLNTLQVNGSIGGAYKSVSATSYNMLANDFVVSWNGAADGFIHLPAADPNFKGRLYFIKNTGSKLLTLQTNGAETIDGNATVVIKPGYHVTVIATGNASGITWEILIYNNFNPTKEFLHVVRATTVQDITGNLQPLLFNRIVASSGITYDVTTGEATLTPGKTYKISISIHGDFNGPIDFFWYLLYAYPSGVQISANAAEVLPNNWGGVNHPASNGVLELIFTATANSYRIVPRSFNLHTSGRVRYDVYSGMAIEEL